MNVAARDRQHGVALLLLLVLMASASVAAIALVQQVQPPLALRHIDTAERLATARGALATAYRRNGAFPTSLAGLAGPAGLPAAGSWRIDPFGAAQDFDYRSTAPSAEVRSRGVDGQLRTADDALMVAAAETPLRARQRGRLRLLRALLFRSQYRTVPTMTAPERDAMRNAMRQLAGSRRSFLLASSTERVALAASIAAATSTISSLCTLRGCTALPAGLTGSGGLLTRIGASDAAGIDGRNRPLLLDTALGILAAGNDTVRGTDDDM
jgi:hypothetical protein